MAEWHYHYNSQGKLEGGTYLDGRVPVILPPKHYTYAEWRPVASWPMGTWFQKRLARRYQGLAESLAHPADLGG